MQKTNTLIIGASAAGLACAAQLSNYNLDYIILEKEAHVAHAWRNHYDRLHLHTNKGASELPFIKYPKGTPNYPPRIQVVKYMEDYQKKMDINPIFNSEVNSTNNTNSQWMVETNHGSYQSNNLIVCTGNTNTPIKVTKPGIDTFPGKVLHSSEYINGKEFTGKNVLIIGFGNSACEIGICLHEHGAHPSFSVRSPVNVIPRDIIGIPVLSLGIAQASFPPKLADTLNKPLIKLIVGDITKYGLRKLPYGPTEQIVKHHKIPLLDIGTMDLIKQGYIDVFGDIMKIKKDLIHFEEDKEKRFDAIIMGTGYQTGLEEIVDISKKRKEDIQLKINIRKYLGKDNLFFCGFYVSPTGMLREISIESGIIAKRILSN